MIAGKVIYLASIGINLGPMSALSSTVLPPSIILTDSEAHLFSFLSKVAESALENASTTTPIVLRVAGGWVRDKVLGLDSDDIIEHLLEEVAQ